MPLTTEELEQQTAYLAQMAAQVYTTSHSIDEIISFVIDAADPQMIAFVGQLYAGDANALVARMSKAFVNDAIDMLKRMVDSDNAARSQPLTALLRSQFDEEVQKQLSAAGLNPPAPQPDPEPQP